MYVISTVKDVATARRICASCAPEYFRVNASHMNAESLRAFAAEYGQDAALSRVPLYVDLQGAKLRVHTTQPVVELSSGSTVPLVCVADDATSAPATSGPAIFVTATLLSLLSAGTHVAIDDGKVAIEVVSVDADKTGAVARVVKGGVVRPRKGFNLRPHPVTFSSLCARDREIVAATKAFPFVRYALSFACLPSEVAELREIAGPEKVLAVKLERPLEDDAVVELGRAAGELWVCRGDMTVQLGSFGALAVFYAHFNDAVLPRLVAAGCSVVMAGEVLEHMCGAPEPTRSEACHLADLYVRGYAGIVVSNETAVGAHPEEVLRVFRAVVNDLEKAFPRKH